nr:reverse transcriptase N-terminal domain-containing protein [Pleurocapsa sp. FMAR1]
MVLAVRRVTQENRGKKTAGVDGIKSLSPLARMKLVGQLKLTGKSKPTRRVWIPKPNGEKRPLGIPTLEERAKQCLVKMAIEPQWESQFEENSYGFRPARSGHDAIEAIFLAIRSQPKYVKDTYNNLQLLHRHCHDKKSKTDGSYDKPFKPVKLPDGWRWNEYDILII